MTRRILWLCIIVCTAGITSEFLCKLFSPLTVMPDFHQMLGIWIFFPAGAANTTSLWIEPPGGKHSAILGTNYTLRCSVHGQVVSQGDYKLKWFFNNKTLIECSSEQLEHSGLQYGKTCNLSLSPVELSSAGVYTCFSFGDIRKERNIELKVALGESCDAYTLVVSHSCGVKP